MQYEPDEDSEVLEKLRAARPPEIVRKKHPEFDTEFDPVKVVRQAERDRLEKVSLEYREKERFLRPSHVKEEDVVEAIQRVAAPRKSHNKPLRPPPPRPLKKEYPFRIGPPAFSRTQAMHDDTKGRHGRPGRWMVRSCMEKQGAVLWLAAGAAKCVEWKDGALTVVGYVDEEAEAPQSGRCGGRDWLRERRVSPGPRPRERMRRCASASVARRLGFAKRLQRRRRRHKPTGGPRKPRRRGRPTGRAIGRRPTRFRRGSSRGLLGDRGSASSNMSTPMRTSATCPPRPRSARDGLTRTSTAV